jgi:hypothetical protein
MPTPVAPDGESSSTANQSAASRILHDRIGDDARLGPPEEIGGPREGSSPTRRLLTRWFSTVPRADDADRERPTGVT